MDESLRKVRGMGAKVRGYIKALHPELGNKATARQLLDKYPEYEELVGAIQAHDPNLKERSVSSFRSNLRGAYEYMHLLNQSQRSTVKRKREETVDDGNVTKKAATVESMALPNSLSGSPGAITGDEQVESKLDSLVTEQMQSKPFGDVNPSLADGVQNLEQPLPTYSIQQKNYPLTDAVTEGMAIDMAEEDPVKPTKELEFIPDQAESTLLTIQDENYLETRNAGRLLHTTILPAAAIVPNNGAGAREGVRRSDNDLEVEESAQEAAADGTAGAAGGSRNTGTTKQTPFTQIKKGESDLTVSQMVSTGDIRGLSGVARSGINIGNVMAKTAAALGGAALMGSMLPTVNAGAAAAAASAYQHAQPYMEATASVAKNAGLSLLATRNIRTKMQREGFSAADISQFIQKKNETEGSTELEAAGKRVVVDELRPFLPIAGSADVELRPGDIEQKKRNVALFANYKPPNWPLGNMDNQLYFQNLVLQGVHWMSPLDSIPPVLPGGSLHDGVADFSSVVMLPSDDMLMDLAVRAQVEFRLNHAEQMVNRLRCLHASEARSTFMQGDIKFIHNPMALGVDSSMEAMSSLMNPLSNPMHRDLRVGGSRALMPIMPQCDALTTDRQIGYPAARPPSTSYTQDLTYNMFAMYPGVF